MDFYLFPKRIHGKNFVRTVKTHERGQKRGKYPKSISGTIKAHSQMHVQEPQLDGTRVAVHAQFLFHTFIYSVSTPLPSFTPGR